MGCYVARIRKVWTGCRWQGSQTRLDSRCRNREQPRAYGARPDGNRQPTNCDRPTRHGVRRKTEQDGSCCQARPLILPWTRVARVPEPAWQPIGHRELSGIIEFRKTSERLALTTLIRANPADRDKPAV